jgi:hypothetical protein
LQALPLMQRPPQTKHSVSVALQGLDAVALAGRKLLAWTARGFNTLATIPLRSAFQTAGNRIIGQEP